MFKAQVDYHPYLYLHAKVGAALLVRVRSLKPRALFDSTQRAARSHSHPLLRLPLLGPACTLRSCPLGCCMATVVPPHVPLPQDDLEMEVDSWLRRRFEGSLKEVEIVRREDLDLVGCCGDSFMQCSAV
jgi:hypothetical protein